MASRGTVTSQATLVVGLFVRIYTPIKWFIGGYFGASGTSARASSRPLKASHGREPLKSQVLQVVGPREDVAERILRPCFSADRSENLGLPTEAPSESENRPWERF